MSEIEKLMQNAGVEKIKGACLFCPLDVHTCVRSYDECPYCYPPFTATKQIELCKWLIKNYRRYVFDVIEADSFETDLAKFMNEEWQDLTSEEKQQVKGILE